MKLKEYSYICNRKGKELSMYIILIALFAWVILVAIAPKN